MCLSQTVMQSILRDAPSPCGLFHLRLNVDGMNEIDQLGVCWQQPCVNSLGVAVAGHWGM